MIYEWNRISLFAKYEQPEVHKHYAKHFLLSKNPFIAVVGKKRIHTRSIFIQSNIVHEILYDLAENLFVMLIDESSNLSDAIDAKYLKGQCYLSDVEELEENVMPYLESGDLKKTDAKILSEILGEEKPKKALDPQIRDAICYAESLRTIDEECFSKMAEVACLSKSRFSHLFKENMHIDCKNFLLQKKFEKAFKLLLIEGYSITDAAMEAGFSSSSHIASAFKNHFGISISKFIKEQKIEVGKK